MGSLLLVFLAAAILLPLLYRYTSFHVFYLAAAVPLLAGSWVATLGPQVLSGQPYVERFEWISELSFAIAFRIDALSWLLCLIVLFVGALVLVYCARYFTASDSGVGAFAGYLLGFAGCMFGLVTVDDVFGLYTFWEITSILSYLLIGHYRSRSESRGAALQSLIVTTFGGLAMLVGLVILVWQGGTSSLSELIGLGLEGPLVVTAILLILAGAVSKSAIVPFHFWLPGAMAAPTPVSAYLHAAAMVKAGIYLVARLIPGFGDLPGVREVVIVLGAWTMLLGAWRALRQYDLKLILAYSTVSQLGFMTLTIGFGGPHAALAGIALLLAHAAYKAALFLAVGVIERRAGSRDWRNLSGLGRRAPILAAVATVAAASMAGIPPLIGFVAKDAVFGAFLEAALAGDAWGWVMLVVAVLGSTLTVAYSLRFVWGAFATREGAEQAKLSQVTRQLLVAPALLAAFSLVAGVGVAALSDGLAAAAGVGEAVGELSLWHGLSWPLGLSALVILGGFGLAAARPRVAALQELLKPRIDLGRGYLALVADVNRFAARLTLVAQRGGLSQYVGVILVSFVVVAGVGLALGDNVLPELVVFDYPAQVFIGMIMVGAALLAALAKQRVSAAIFAGVTGYGLVAIFALNGAPDLALTQALVETITLVAFVLVMRRLPTHIGALHKSVRRRWRALIGGAVGLAAAAAALVAVGARNTESISKDLPRLIAEHAHGENIVNTMLVDVRGWDTMGEISVLVVVATGIASLLFVSGRAASAERMQDSALLRSASRRGRVVADPAASSEGYAVMHQSWLIAGRAMPEHDRSIMLEVLVRLLFHPAIVVSLYVLLVGHNQPGGGFAGGLIAGLAVVGRYIVGGRYELAEAAPMDPGKLLGVGILLAAGSAAWPLFMGWDALTATFFSFSVPWLGVIDFSTTTIFDIGVYLVVLGLAFDLLRSLGSEVDRQLLASKRQKPRRARAVAR